MRKMVSVVISEPLLYAYFLLRTKKNIFADSTHWMTVLTERKILTISAKS